MGDGRRVGRQGIGARRFLKAESDRETFSSDHGGIAYGKTGSKVIAFWHAGGQAPLDCTVFGWLRTGEGQTVVVAEEVIFHVGREVAAAARERMEDPDAGD